MGLRIPITDRALPGGFLAADRVIAELHREGRSGYPPKILRTTALARRVTRR
jgi:hypothetical protein